MENSPGFAVWITGLPASGKSTIAISLADLLWSRYGIRLTRLESDQLRKVLTPEPSYKAEERSWFYSAMLYIGRILVENGLNVVFDATANRRSYRDEARKTISKFLEVYVKCPLSVCMARDPKGIYRKAEAGATNSVPGLQVAYEEPLSPDVVIESDRASPEVGAEKIVNRMRELGWL